MNPIYHYDIEQGGEAWHSLRCGRIGGTSSAALLVNGKSASGLGAGVFPIIYRKAAELVAGPEPEGYVSEAMQRGTDLEPVARRRYEDETFCTVQQVGYISVGDYLGHSPDGLVGPDGMIEIKCPAGPEFVRFACTGDIPKEHYSQMQWGMFLTGRVWCDYVVFHPDFEPGDLIVSRVRPDADLFGRWMERVPTYVAELERVLNRVAALKADL